MKYMSIAAVVLLVVGVLTLLVFALADVVGIGGDPNVFGYVQISGSVVGAIVTAVGAVLYWLGSRRK